MKLNKILTCAWLLCLAEVTLINGLNAESASKEMAQPKTGVQKKTYTDEQKKNLLTAFGWTMGMQTGIKALGLSEKELEFFVEGLRLAVKGQESPVSISEVMADLQSFLQEKSEAYAKVREAEVKEMSAKNKKAGEDFLAKLLKENTNVKKSSTGLHYEILAIGNEKEKPTENDSVKINYIGKLIDGKIFDQSKNTPVTFPLQGVVPGLKEGLQLIGKGGKVKLYIPAGLAYGEHDIPMIPPGSVLVFDIELLEIQKSTETPAVPHAAEMNKALEEGKNTQKPENQQAEDIK